MIIGGRLCAATALLSTALSASAGGLYIYNVNPADTVTPESVWLNPAGMTSMAKPTAQAKAGVVVPIMKFDADVATAGGSNGGDAGNAAVLPDLAYVRPLGGNWWAGLSVTGLFGGNIDYGKNFVGRYAVTKVELQGVGLVPSLAYKFNDDFSIGAGVAVVRSELTQEIAFNNLIAADGKVQFDGLDDWGVQPFVGMNYRLNEHTLFGIVYRAEMDLELEGDAKFSNIAPGINPNPNFKRPIKVDWTNAQTIEVGLEHHLSATDIVQLTGSWEDWSAFDDNVLTLNSATLIDPVTLKRNWKDTWSIGGQYIRIVGRGAYTIGMNYVSSPVDDKDRTFDLPFDESFRVKLGYVFEPRGNTTYSLGGSLIFGGDAEIDQTTLAGTPLQTRAAGEFDTNMIVVFGGSVRYSFD
jgi:long-chain fatty acid transport protein